MRYKVHQPAENYVLLDFGNKIDEKTNIYVLALAQCIKHKAIIEVVPAYSSLLIEYDNNELNPAALLKYIKTLKPQLNIKTGKLHEMPVVYGGESGPDLTYLATKKELSEKRIIELHSNCEYRVYMLGFQPGFLYLGGLDPAISCERKKVPRLKISKGSVGIAGMQTGIYPAESPGGWQIIGKTAYEIYRPDSDKPFPIQAGDTVRFVPVETGGEL